MNNKKYIIIVTVVVLIVVTGIFLLFKNKSIEPQPIVSNPVEPVEQAAIKLEQEKNKNIEIMKSLDDALDKSRQTDKDLDGLSDEEEKKLDTNPDNIDTDGDGLMDSDEVKIYRTDPLKADTDGDGYKDGYEVERGYDPAGSGKLKK